MPAPELSAAAQQWANDILMWVGFGTVVGLAAKGVMPGRDPGGAVATMCMGIGGSIIGCGTLSYFYYGVRVKPISPIGFIVATAGAFSLLFFYRLFLGRIVQEGDRAPLVGPVSRRRSRYNRSARFDD